MKTTNTLTWAWIALWNGILLPQHISVAQSQNDLDAARALWFSLTKGMPSDYTFEYLETTEAGASTSPSVVDVRNDTVTNVYPREFANFDDPILDPSDFPTITDLFDLIQDAINEGTDDPLVEYNTRYGYPNFISIQNGATGSVVIDVPTLIPYTILEYELDTYKALWESYEDTASYSYFTQVSCFCEMSYVTPKFIVVENNTIVSTIDVETGASSDFTYDTIPGLFSRIQDAIDNYYVVIDVSYDETFGYPSTLLTDPEYNLMDAGISIQTGNVTLADMEEETMPPTTSPQTETSPTAAPLRKTQWCFGYFKFTAWCNQGN